MESERWKKAKDIFEQAMVIGPGSRARFLDAACAGDATIRLEVDELLCSLDTAASFLEVPAVGKKTNNLEPGQTLSRYKIVEQIGSGGMGEVFLATDVTLKRKVALKLLPAEFTTDQERLQRFEQEALAASALNHPNILTIYEIGESDGMNFIATEYIDGATLRSLIQAGDLTFEKILDIAIQSVSALSAAHDVSIVHRDIKPENIMVRTDGIVKILDFGLAKSVAPPEHDEDAETIRLGQTREGMIMGTVAYMSPEQARGRPVDTRTDIWSFGVVLYEMIAGCTPFRGETASDTIASILKTDPETLSDETPAELRRIVTKSMRHDRDERYQTANDLLIDLRNLKQDLEFNKKLERKSGTISGSQLATASKTTTNEEPANTLAISTVVNRPSRSAIAAIAFAVIILGVTGVGYYFLRGTPAAQLTMEPAKIESLAVLPFANSNQETEYLSDGITESLINSLSNLPSLRVISRDTAFNFKGTTAPLADIAKTLNVRTVLTGKMTQQGDSMTIQADLVDVATNSQVWGERYNVKMSDILNIEAQIAQRITEKLQLKLNAQQQAQISKRYTENSEAYSEYLKGRYYTLQYSPDGHRKALEHLNRAVDIDPTFALAYAGIADAYTTVSEGLLPPREALPKAKTAAQKAIDLDDKVADAWAARGHARIHELDRSAIDDLNHAASLAPNSLTTQLWVGEYYMIWDVEKSIQVLENAARMDPLSPIPPAFIGFDYYLLRQYDKAIIYGHKSMELDPHFATERAYIAQTYCAMGDAKSAENELNKIPPEAIDGLSLSAKAKVLAIQGKRREAEGVLVQMRRLAETQYVSPFEIAAVYVSLNDRDQAFAYLNKAYDDGSEHLGFMRNMPLFDPIRDDPRYSELIKRIGFDR